MLQKPGAFTLDEQPELTRDSNCHAWGDFLSRRKKRVYTGCQDYGGWKYKGNWVHEVRPGVRKGRNYAAASFGGTTKSTTKLPR